MLRNAIVILVLLLLALEVADAKTPKIGDYVRIDSNNGFGPFEGQITDIEDGMICLEVLKKIDNSLFDVCIGIGAIVDLRWISTDETEQWDKNTSKNLTQYLMIYDESVDGETLPGVRVTGQDGAGERFDKTTNSYGNTYIIGPPGMWRFEASMTGYQTKNWDKYISSNGSIPVFLTKDETGQDTETELNIGNRVRTTSDKKLNVRIDPGTNSTSIDTMVKGSMGTIIEGPVFTDNLYWWKIKYDTGTTGWSSGKWLELAPQA